MNVIEGEKYYFEWCGNTKVGKYRGQRDDGYVFENLTNHDKYILNNLKGVSKLCV